MDAKETDRKQLTREIFRAAAKSTRIAGGKQSNFPSQWLNRRETPQPYLFFLGILSFFHVLLKEKGVKLRQEKVIIDCQRMP